MSGVHVHRGARKLPLKIMDISSLVQNLPDSLDVFDVVKRLNEATDMEWSFEIGDTFIRQHEAGVLVKVTVYAEASDRPIVKMAFGHAPLAGDEPSVGAGLKAACKDALLGAVSLFGLTSACGGKRVVEQLSPDAGRDPLPPQSSQESSPSERGQIGKFLFGNSDPPCDASRETTKRGEPPRVAVESDRPQVNSKGSMLTERQLNAIMAIGRTLGWTSEALRSRSLDVYGRGPADLTRKEASEFIGELQQIATRMG